MSPNGLRVRRLSKRDLPLDVLHLDIDYMQNYRVFTFNRERFPNPKALFKYMLRSKIMSRNEIFQLLCDRHDSRMRAFATKLEEFLCR